jgi:WD40 repeat protein
VESAAFSPDGSRIVTASEDKTARIWDAATGKEIMPRRGHEGGVKSAAFSPDGSRIVTASSSSSSSLSFVFGGFGRGSAHIWDAATAKQIAILQGYGEFAAFSPDGSRLVAASLSDASIWDAGSAKVIAVLHCEGITKSGAYSPDGSRIVTASADGTARIWDAATAKEIMALRGRERFVNSAAFSPNGSRIVTASSRTARIWDAATAKEIMALRGHEHVVNSVAFSPDGSHIVTASEDGTARIWGAHLQTMSAKDLLVEACARLAGVTKLTREEMRLAGYPDSMPQIDVCTSTSGQ